MTYVANSHPDMPPPMHQHDPDRYGEAKARQLNILLDSYYFRLATAEGFRKRRGPNEQAEQGVRQARIRYLAERNAAVEAFPLERDAAFDDVNRDLLGSVHGHGGAS